MLLYSFGDGESNMNEINKQVARAKRRLMTGQFFRVLTWSMFAGLLLATIGMLIPKIWHLAILENQRNQEIWTYSWIAGGLILALLVSTVLTWLNRRSTLDVAVEVDRRFNLKERLSSALALTPTDAESNVGQALVEDAVSRAETIDVRDQFQFQPTWRALLPAIPIVLLAILLFVPNAMEKEVAATEPDKVDRKQVELAIKEFKKKVEEKRNELTAKGLDDADKNLTSLEKKVDQLLDDKNSDKKNTLVKLNDIKKQIEDRQKELGGKEELEESLNKLKDVSSGPAKQIADAMSKGDMQEAQKAIKDLVDKLKEGKLNEIEKKQLAKDLEAMAKQLQEIAKKHEQEKQELQDQLKKALENGDLDKAAELQQKLDQKQQQEKQMQKMEKMAENLQKCADCMKPGANGQPKQGQQGQQQPNQNGEQQAQAMKEAAESLEDLAQQLEQMQQDMQEMDALQDLEKIAGECKGCMNGDEPGDDEPKMQDWAKGGGRGHGKRDLEEEETRGFKARVKGKLQQGETVVTGNADGVNITGRSASEARELVQASMSIESDPLENQKLPKAQREHAQQYFESLRKND